MCVSRFKENCKETMVLNTIKTQLSFFPFGSVSGENAFNKKNNWKTNWNILQPSKHPGAARFLSSKPQPFCCARANTSSMAPVHLALGVLVEPKRSDSRHLGEMSISAKSSNQGFCLWSPLLKTEPGTEPRNNDSPETSKTRVTGVV